MRGRQNEVARLLVAVALIGAAMCQTPALSRLASQWWSAMTASYTLFAWSFVVALVLFSWLVVEPVAAILRGTRMGRGPAAAGDNGRFFLLSLAALAPFAERFLPNPSLWLTLGTMTAASFLAAVLRRMVGPITKTASGIEQPARNKATSGSCAAGEQPVAADEVRVG